MQKIFPIVLGLAVAMSVSGHGLTIYELPIALEVKEPRILPISIFYPWKELWRSIERATTRAREAKARLALRIADEKLVELAFVIDEQSDEERAMRRALENYRKEINRLAGRISSSGENSDEFTRRATNHLFVHAKIIREIGSLISEDLGRESENAIASALRITADINGDSFAREIVSRTETDEPEAREDLDTLAALRAINSELDRKLRDLGFPGTPHQPTPPSPCTNEYHPVCGGDGKTYGNRCLADAAGATVSYEGQCRVSRPPAPLPQQPPSEPPRGARCVVAGCNGELCVSAEEGLVVSPCIYKPEFACYKNATCGPQPNGQCGWTETAELQACLLAAEKPAPPPAPSVYEIALEADDSGFYPAADISVPKGATVQLTITVRTTNVYYAGLDIRSEKFQTPPIMPGASASVTFTADQSFEFKSYWPFSNMVKATGKVTVTE